MSVLYRWVADTSKKLPGLTLSGEQVAPTFMQMPADVFVNFCQWLSVRDILCLRMANKRLAGITRESIIWNSVLRKLMVPLPILPATSKYRFGDINPQTYESLMVRALYLEQNWRRQNPAASHSRFEAFDRTLTMKMLPGGKYMVTTLKNLETGMYSVVVWDLDHAGRRVPLTAASSRAPFMKLEAAFGVVDDEMSIVIAYARPPARSEHHEGMVSTVVACYVPIFLLEELVEVSPDSEEFRSFTDAEEFPFQMIHQSSTNCDVGQIALGDFDGEMVLLVVHRPHALVFHYLNSGKQGNLLLDVVHPYATLRHSIWAVKLLTGQNSVLVSRVLVEHGVQSNSTLFTLDIFLLPGEGSTYKGPAPMARQILCGLQIDGFYFSDLETSWYASMRDPDGLLPAPINNEPPPISIFATTREPRGFVQFLMRPGPLPNEYLKLPYKRGYIQRFAYNLPAVKIQRDTWTDECARPVIIPGAYRSIVSMRPHVSPSMHRQAARGIETLRFCTYRTRAEGYDTFSTPCSTGNLCTVTMDAEDAMEVEEEIMVPAAELEEASGLRKRSLHIPAIPSDLAWDMMAGTMGIAFEESTGRMCVATDQDTYIHVLDFGGETWGLAEVKA